jgi:hypothetical protein
MNIGNHTFLGIELFSISHQPNFVAIAVVNGDRKVDVIVTFHDRDEILDFIQRFGNVFSNRVIYKTKWGSALAVAADFNVDMKSTLL